MVATALRSDLEICAVAQELADKHIAPRAEEHDRTGEFPLDNLAELGKSGLMGLLVPPEYGGLGGTITQFSKVSEILATACPSTSMIWGMHTNQYVNLVEHGTEEQKAAILPAIARGEILAASGTTEPGTGGNFFYCNSAAEKTQTGWKFTATKPVSTSAPYADYCFCITRADPESHGAHLSFFMVPCKVEGVTQIGEWNTVGLRATQSSGIQFSNVPLTSRHLIGQEGGFGLVALTTMMPVGLCGFAACWLGAAQAALNFAVEHVQRRTHQFSIPGDEPGHTVGSYESVQRQIAEASIMLSQTRSFLYHVARSIDEAKPGPSLPMPLDRALALAESSLSLRVASGENAIMVTNTALRVAGAQGYRRDYLRIERCHRDALAAQVMAPAPDMAKVFLGKLRLGYTLEQAIGLQ
jgi:alkylation response protein AidB-like acyl-CoA dehydrogenase